MSQMHAVRMTMQPGGWREVAVVLPNNSSSAQIYAEARRKLRERFGVVDAVIDHEIRRTWSTNMPDFA